jgi:hypothetical protein
MVLLRSDFGMGKMGDYLGPLMEDIYPGRFSLDGYSGFELDGGLSG